MTHDPALEAHEHAEHAEHAAHEHDPFISRVSITIAILAVLAAARRQPGDHRGRRGDHRLQRGGAEPGQGHRRLGRVPGRQPEEAPLRHRRRRGRSRRRPSTPTPPRSRSPSRREVKKQAQEDEAERDKLLARQPRARAPPPLADRGGDPAGDRHRHLHRGDHHAAQGLLAGLDRPGPGGPGAVRRRPTCSEPRYFGGAGYWILGFRFSTTAWASKARGSSAGLAPLWVTISAEASKLSTVRTSTRSAQKGSPKNGSQVRQP